MRIWNAGLKCAARGSLKYRTQKLRRKLPFAHHRTTLSGYIFAMTACIVDTCLCCEDIADKVLPFTVHVSTIEKKLVKHHLLHMSSQPMLNFGPLTAEIGWRVWGTQQISTGCASSLRYCTDVVQQQSSKFCMFGGLLGWYTLHYVPRKRDRFN